VNFTVSSSGPLKGRIQVPGDARLTLTLMSLAMHMEERITVINPSGAHVVTALGEFLERHGAVRERSDNGFSFTGVRLKGDVVIDDTLSDGILHCIIAGAVFTSQSVRITGGVSSRARVVKLLVDILATCGLNDDNVAVDGDDCVITGAVFAPSGPVKVESQWAFESVIAASLAARSPVVISYTSEVLPLSEKVMKALGFAIEPVEEVHDSQAELERRMAKASGEKPREVRRFEWTGKPSDHIEIPGDMTLAAALAGCAVVTQRSDITIQGVVWDRERNGFFDSLRRMKAEIEIVTAKGRRLFDTADIQVRWSRIKGVHFSPGNAHTMGNELLILAAVAASAGGKTVIVDIPEVPVAGREAFKLLARGLEKLGVKVGDYTDGIVLRGRKELKGGELDSGGRPDVACALAVAGFNAAGTTTIAGCDQNIYPVREFLSLIETLST